MGSYVTVNLDAWKMKKNTFIVKMSTYSEIALQAGKEAIIAHALAHAPNPYEEKRAVLEDWQLESGTEFHKDDPAEGARVRFTKNGGDQLYIQQLLSDPAMQDLIFMPRTDLKMNVGFMIAPLRFIDSMTKFTWINATKDGQVGEYESKYGTFYAFEYGLQYIAKPRAGSMLSPEPGIFVRRGKDGSLPAVARRVEARPMFSNLNTQEILSIMRNVLNQVKFNEE